MKTPGLKGPRAPVVDNPQDPVGSEAILLELGTGSENPVQQGSRIISEDPQIEQLGDFLEPLGKTRSHAEGARKEVSDSILKDMRTRSLSDPHETPTGL